MSALTSTTSITSASTNLRVSANATARVLGVIPARTPLTVNCTGDWCRTTWQGQAGFVSRSLLTSAKPSGTAVSGTDAVSFANCAAARAAGYSNIRVGEPGYRAALDRDDDGVACER